MDKKNLGLRTINRLCDYLNLEQMSVYSKLSNEREDLLNKTLESNEFNKWFKIRVQQDKIEESKAKQTIEILYGYYFHIPNETQQKTIIDSLSFLLSRSYFVNERPMLQTILSSNAKYEVILNELRASKPFSLRKENTGTIVSNDEFDNFYWGGLNGEEAYIGFWNTD